MAFETKELSGSLFKNDRKDKPSHPDYKGTFKVKGEEYWVSGWIKETKGGDKYLSCAMTLKDEQPVTRPTTPSTFDDDDIPF